MGLSSAAMERRKGRITASAVPAILGLDPFRSPREAWLDILQERPNTSGPAAVLGNCYEAGTLEAFECFTGLRVARRNIWRVSDDGLIGATLDGENDPDFKAERAAGMPEWQEELWDQFAPYAGDPAVVEVKTSGLNSRIPLTEWGEANTDEVPRRVLIQAHAQLYAAPEKARVFVPALLAGRGLTVYRIERDADMMGLLHERALAFKVDFLDPKKEPPATFLDEETLRAVERKEGTVARVAPALVRAWREAREARLAAEKVESAAFVAMLDAAGDAETIDGGEEGIVTYRRNKPSMKVDLKALEAAVPDVASQFRREVPGARVPRWKKAVAS